MDWWSGRTLDFVADQKMGCTCHEKKKNHRTEAMNIKNNGKNNS